MIGHGTIFACVRRDELLARARAGDQTALAVLERLLPRHLPARELLRQRDESIREIAARLRADQCARSERQLAKILTLAGARLRSPRGRLPDLAPFQGLDHEERDALARDIRAILDWSRSLDWPREDRMRQIINNLGG
jgi:hypothetical protein